MTPCDPMAVAVDWLDHYRASRITPLINMYSPDAVIDCACEGRKIIQGGGGITAYWRHRLIADPAAELEDLRMDRGCVVVTYRTNSGIVQTLLDITENGLIARCRCGPVGAENGITSVAACSAKGDFRDYRCR